MQLILSKDSANRRHLPSFAFSFNHPEGMCPHCQGLGKEVKIDLDLFVDKEKSLRDGALLHPNYKQNSYLLKELLKYGIFDNDKPLKDWSISYCIANLSTLTSRRLDCHTTVITKVSSPNWSVPSSKRLSTRKVRTSRMHATGSLPIVCVSIAMAAESMNVREA